MAMKKSTEKLINELLETCDTAKLTIYGGTVRHIYKVSRRGGMLTLRKALALYYKLNYYDTTTQKETKGKTNRKAKAHV